MRKSSNRLAIFAAVATTALLAGCGSGTSGDNSDGESGGGEGGGDQSLTFVTYGSAFQEAQEVSMVDPFMAETGIDVTVESPVDPAKLKVMVEQGNPTWDVYLAGQQDVPAYCGTLFEELDTSNIDTENFAEGTVDECGIAVDTYSYMIVYNTNTYPDNPPDGIEDFFDLEQYPGTRSMGMDPLEGNLEMALMADGVEVDDLYPLDFDRAFAKLDTIKPQTIFWTSGAEQVAIMEEQRADMMLVWSGRGAEAVANGAPYAPVWEDNSYHWASLAIVKGTPNREAAQKFIEYAVSPEAQTLWAESIAYGPANLAATPQLTPELQEWDSSSEEHRELSWQIDNDYWAENLPDIEERWIAWTSG